MYPATYPAPPFRDSVFHPAQFGGKGDGITDDTAAIQAAIDACIGGDVAGGATKVRSAKGVLSLDGRALGLNKWKITAPLKIYSVAGFTLRGDGEECLISVSGNLTNALEINGSYFGTFEAFTIIGNTVADTVTSALSLEWDPTTAVRSSTGNNFRRVNVRNLKYVNAFGIALSNPSKQNDNCTFDHCAISGSWSSGELTWWQNGYAVGNGTFGNVLNFHFKGCTAAGNRYNHRVNAITGFTVFGSSVGNAEADFNLNIGVGCVINGVRSEQSQRLLTTGASSASAHLELSNVAYAPGSQAADGQLIQWGYGGSLVLTNVSISQSVTNFVIRIIANATRVSTILVNGGSSFTAAASLITTPGATAPFSAMIRGYSQVNASGQVIANTTELDYVGP